MSHGGGRSGTVGHMASGKNALWQAPTAPVGAAPEHRWLCCEGRCSRKSRQKIAAVIDADATRMIESSQLVHTPHRCVRVASVGDARVYTWACAVCGTERLYGAEDLDL